MIEDVGFHIKGMSPQFLVENLERSIEFYTKQLDFQISFRYEDFYCGIQKNGFSIHLKSGKSFIKERENKKRNDHLDITFSVDEIENLYQYILKKSVNIIQPLRKMDYGTEFYISDPDNYIISFLKEN